MMQIIMTFFGFLGYQWIITINFYNDYRRKLNEKLKAYFCFIFISSDALNLSVVGLLSRWGWKKKIKGNSSRKHSKKANAYFNSLTFIYWYIQRLNAMKTFSSVLQTTHNLLDIYFQLMPKYFKFPDKWCVSNCLMH